MSLNKKKFVLLLLKLHLHLHNKNHQNGERVPQCVDDQKHLPSRFTKFATSGQEAVKQEALSCQFEMIFFVVFFHFYIHYRMHRMRSSDTE